MEQTSTKNQSQMDQTSIKNRPKIRYPIGSWRPQQGYPIGFWRPKQRYSMGPGGTASWDILSGILKSSWRGLGSVLEGSWRPLGPSRVVQGGQHGSRLASKTEPKSIKIDPKIDQFFDASWNRSFSVFSWICGTKNRAMLVRKSIQESILS